MESRTPSVCETKLSDVPPPLGDHSAYLWPVPFWRWACGVLDTIEKYRGVLVAGLLAALIAESLSFLFAASWYDKELYVSRFTGLSQDPFKVGEVPIPYPEHRLRLLGPVIAWALGLRGMSGVLVPILANIPLLALVYWFIRRRTSVQMGLAFTMLMATTHLTMTSRTILGYQDSLVYLCCLGVLLARHPVLRGGLLFLALYGDIRAVMICPFLLIWPDDASRGIPPLVVMARRTLICILAIGAWIVSAKTLLHLFQYDQLLMDRFLMTISGDLERINVSRINLSAFLAFKAAWFFLLVAVWEIGRQKWFWGGYLVIVLIGIAGPSLLVHDISRALGYCFPLILLGIVAMWRRSPQACTIATGMCLIVNLIMPSYHGLAWRLWEISYPLPFVLLRHMLHW